MISKLPKWVEFGALLLAAVAGCINAVAVLGFEHQAVSHVSGTATLLGTELLSGELTSLLHLFGVIVSFAMGAMISGAMLHGTSLKLGQHYDTMLIIEALTLVLASYWLSNGWFIGHFAASAACGMQNALATTYSGAVVRTTHLTGIVTDLGLMIGAAIRKAPFDRRKALLFVSIITGFIAGGFMGAVLYHHYDFSALLIPACMCAMLAALYRWFARRQGLRTL